MFAGVNRLFLDVLFLAAAGFIAIVIIIWPLINPPGKKLEEDLKPPGSIIVEIRWPDGRSTDVDLWVKAPGGRPVGYSNKSGKTFNLLRDDLGNTNDLMHLNYENAYSRGVPAGEWVVNLHLYRDREGIYPLPVQVRVSRKTIRAIVTIYSGTAYLNHEGEEITVVRFTTDEQGRITSRNKLFRQLRSAQ